MSANIFAFKNTRCLFCVYERVSMLMLLMASSFFTGNIQDVILQEHIEKEDKVLVSLAGLKQVGLLCCFTRCDAPLDFLSSLRTRVSFLLVPQIKDILKGALRFNQSQLEAEENEEITIADDHYTSTASASASATVLSSVNHHPQEDDRCKRDCSLHAGASTSDKEEEQGTTPPPPQVN